ncbi:unnamed protein product [Sphagnum troendelagicum]|uniref:Cilia- and flagella-associated protein 58 central coiled coil domain-containing protein n=1 Tax=Sphagnum troendelagicum TaxID=128251 RepID=A0ABP0UVI1_9BRYO
MDSQNTSQEEIEDPERYASLELSKIDNVHGALARCMIEGYIKQEHANFLKQKFEDLRSFLRSKIVAERKLLGETADLLNQIKAEEEELEKLEKSAVQHEELLAMARDDAEEAESQASIAKEREQNQILNSSLLEKIQEEYIGKVKSIEHEHFTAMEPILARIEEEIRQSKRECAEGMIKIELCTKEIEETKSRHSQCLQDNATLCLEKNDHFNKLEELSGTPEKTRKQSNILLNAVRSLQLQEEKWVIKVGELNKEIQAVHNITKEKTEEHGNMVINLEKIWLHTEQQKCVAQDMVKDLEASSLELESCLNEQVSLQLQLLQLLSDLQHEQAIAATRIKERDRAIKRMKEVEVEVEHLHSQLPVYKQEKEKASRELIREEAERETCTTRAEEHHQEFEICMSSLLVVDTFVNEVAAKLRESNANVENLEKETVVCIVMEHKQEQHIKELTNLKERFSRAAAAKLASAMQIMERVTIETSFSESFQKRILELQKRYNEGQALYNLMRSQQNNYTKLIESCKVTILEMKEKVVALSQEVEMLQNGVLDKVKCLGKMHGIYVASLEGCFQVRREITKCRLALKAKKHIINEAVLEVLRLQEFIRKIGKGKVKACKEYYLIMKDRNNIGLSYIDRNDELCILYEKSNVQVDLLKNSGLELIKRMNEIAHLQLACKLMHSSLKAAERNAPDPTATYAEIISLKKQVNRMRWHVCRLSEFCENPIPGVERCLLLPGNDLNKSDLERKASAITELLSAKEDEAAEKNIILEEVFVLADKMMRTIAIEWQTYNTFGEKLNEKKQNVQTANRRIIATSSELSLMQARAHCFHREKQAAWDRLNQAYIRLNMGQAPTDDTEKKMKQMESQSLYCLMQRPQTTPLTRPEKRPNAYIGEALGVPLPFGAQSPFRPSLHRISSLRQTQRPRTAKS